LGGPLLNGYSPAEQVGAGVRPRIRTLLLANPDFRELLGKTRATSSLGVVPAASREAALEALAKMRRSLDEIEGRFSGLGTTIRLNHCTRMESAGRYSTKRGRTSPRLSPR
jgi:hypothetical protein